MDSREMRFISARTDKEVRIRLPPLFVDILDKEAMINGRSRSAEILVRIWSSVEDTLINKYNYKDLKKYEDVGSST